MSHPIVPRTNSETGPGLPADILGAFIGRLRATGHSASQISALRRGARHFLTWLCLCGIAVASVDDAALCAFSRHDCNCPDMKEERHERPASDGRRIITGALKPVQFLEDQGRIPHPGGLDANLRHLDGFMARCKEEGHGPDPLQKHRSSCQHILTWLHRPRIPVTEVSAETPELFLRHDRVCPGTRKSPRRQDSGARCEHPFRRFPQHLGETGAASAPVMTPEPETDPATAPFEAWLRRHRGIGESSVRRHSRQAAMPAADLGPDPGSYDAALLRRYAGVSRGFAGKLAGVPCACVCVASRRRTGAHRRWPPPGGWLPCRAASAPKRSGM